MVINNGTDTDRFRPDPDAREAVRREWGVREESPLVGIVGRLNPVKGHKDFLKAASLLIKERPDIRFVCIGGGDVQYVRELKMLSSELGLGSRLIWAGNRSDMPSVMNALDVLCSSSYSEGFPNVICEAMACGVPCVVTDVGDSAYIVGGYGIDVPPSDPAALAKGLARMIDGRLQIRLADSRRRIEENFTVESMIDKTENALVELLD